MPLTIAVAIWDATNAALPKKPGLPDARAYLWTEPTFALTPVMIHKFLPWALCTESVKMEFLGGHSKKVSANAGATVM